MLYIVATPIGNLQEMSFRAVEVLKNVSLIATEDTRRSLILLNHFEIKTPLTSYQKFNENQKSDLIVGKLKNGEDVALISDAGTPLISDPGSVLIKKCIDNGLDYTVVSGPCALINALILSGLSTQEFTFLGFLPDKQKLRNEKIEPHCKAPCSLIFYSPVQNIKKDLTFLYEHLGKRRVSIVREISKKFESVQRGYLAEDMEITEKGEFVIVVEGYKKELSQESIEDLVQKYIDLGYKKMDAIKKAAIDKGISKSEAYRIINI